jgi:monoterpene epsilon-lactone hydrolase
LVVCYRRPPEHAFPAAVLDGIAAYRFALEAAAASTPVVIAGDSAGGNLAITVTMAAIQAGLPAPAAVIAVSPWTDLTLSADSPTRLADIDPFAHLDDLPRMRDLYLAGADPTEPLASPLFADLADLPPTLVVVGDTETLLDDSTRFVQRAAAAGGGGGGGPGAACRRPVDA